MPNLTSRLSLQQPIGTDPVSEFRTGITQVTGILDNTVLFTRGTLATRPAPGAVEYGHVYQTTDTLGESLSWTDGLNWFPLGLILSIVTGNIAAVSGQMLHCSGASATITLPSHSASQVVGITNYTTNGTTVNGSSIFGPGMLSAASTFQLATPGTSVVLIDNGTNWLIIAGQQDTGWLLLSYSPGITGEAFYYTPGARLVGDTVKLCGMLSIGLTYGPGQTLATLPAAVRPIHSVTCPTSVYFGAGSPVLYTTTSIQITSAGLLNCLDYLVAGSSLSLDSANYRAV